jgi:hypothetical protein
MPTLVTIVLVALTVLSSRHAHTQQRMPIVMPPLSVELARDSAVFELVKTYFVATCTVRDSVASRAYFHDLEFPSISTAEYVSRTLEKFLLSNWTAVENSFRRALLSNMESTWILNIGPNFPYASITYNGVFTYADLIGLLSCSRRRSNTLFSNLCSRNFVSEERDFEIDQLRNGNR